MNPADIQQARETSSLQSLALSSISRSRWRSLGIGLAVGTAVAGCMARSAKTPCLCASPEAQAPWTVSGKPENAAASPKTPEIRQTAATQAASSEVIAALANERASGPPIAQLPAKLEASSPRPSASAAAVPSVPRTGLDEPSWITTLAPHFEGSCCPTIIHTGSRVAIAVPCELEQCGGRRRWQRC